MRCKLIGIILLILVGGALLLSGCTTSQQVSSSSGPEALPATSAASQESLLVYSGAGLKTPMQEIGQAFTDKYGIGVQYTYAGSGTLISQMDLTKKGDVFITGSTVEFKIAQDKGLALDYQPVAYHVPVIAVQKANPKNIKTIQDFARPGLKVALGDTKATAIGKAGVKIFGKYNLTEAVDENVVTRTPTINELNVIMNTGQADAALLTLDQINPEKIDAVSIPVEDNVVLIIPVGVTSFTTSPDSAQKFADFVASDEGKAVFASHGFPSYPDTAYAGINP